MLANSPHFNSTLQAFLQVPCVPGNTPDTRNEKINKVWTLQFREEGQRQQMIKDDIISLPPGVVWKEWKDQILSGWKSRANLTDEGMLTVSLETKQSFHLDKTHTCPQKHFPFKKLAYPHFFISDKIFISQSAIYLFQTIRYQEKFDCNKRITSCHTLCQNLTWRWMGKGKVDIKSNT